MVMRRWINRVRALKIYTFRFILNSCTNAPFVSGDSISKICDVSMYPQMRVKRYSSSDVIKAVSIFVPGHKLDQFLLEYGDLVTAKVLVVGNSDRDFFSLDFEVPKSVKLLVLQNSHISTGSISTLPIGIENLRYGKNGFKRFFRYKNVPKIDKVLVGPFSKTHAERDEIEELSNSGSPNVVVLSKYLSSRKLAKISRKYAYVACPRGNGTDTHRFWETLYRGSIPIVKKSAWSDSLKKYQIPFIEVKTWELKDVFEGIEAFEWSQPFDPRQIEALWIPYWEKMFKLNSK